jgi:hypothetical protein
MNIYPAATHPSTHIVILCVSFSLSLYLSLVSDTLCAPLWVRTALKAPLSLALEHPACQFGGWLRIPICVSVPPPHSVPPAFYARHAHPCFSLCHTHICTHMHTHMHIYTHTHSLSISLRPTTPFCLAVRDSPHTHTLSLLLLYIVKARTRLEVGPEGQSLAC